MKNGHYIEYIDQVLEAFPNGKVIYVYRDPRAMYLSQKRSKTSVEGVPMARNPINMSLEYNKRADILKKYRGSALFTVKYEDLVADAEKVVREALDFIGVEDRAMASDDYFEKIPQEQKHLHTNISRGAIKGRVDAWKESLAPSEVRFIQKYLGGAMNQYGYSPVKVRSGLRDHWQYLVLNWKYFRRLLGKRLKSIQHKTTPTS